jgi:Histidine kinase-, DNA gyrase B-, and HSP90-like ATPase
MFEPANPNPEFLIKSIAEQGYSFESAIADLLDNSLTAKADKIEIISCLDNEPFKLFIADNGNGMDEKSLKINMQFPSVSPESFRQKSDLGRFGLGLKTASFSQTRCFTVLSRRKGTEKYFGMTWDVNYLKQNSEWRIKINSETEIDILINAFKINSKNHLNSFENFSPNTIIIWEGLYKFENFLSFELKKKTLEDEITNTTTHHLAIVFHRFMEKKLNPLKIRINNVIIKPFNPFPIDNAELRALDPSNRDFGEDNVKIQGFILPNSSIKETREHISEWVPQGKSLMDMEGIYIYREDRLILFGGWNGIIKKMARLQLARLRVDVGNKVDHLFHLNVAKSQIKIPYELKTAFLRAVSSLRIEAQKEYYNFGLKTFTSKNTTDSAAFMYERIATNKGVVLKTNEEFPILKSLKSTLNRNQLAELNFILKISSSTINKVRQIDNVEFVNDASKDGISLEEISKVVKNLLTTGFTRDQITKDILPNLGFTNKIPQEIIEILNN